jgi:hypothetical protein
MAARAQGGDQSWVPGRCVVGEGGRRERVVVRSDLQGQVGRGVRPPGRAMCPDVSGPT